MPIGHKDHRGIAGAQVGVGRSRGSNCSFYGGWRDQPEVPLAHVFRAPRLHNCSDNSHCLNSIIRSQPAPIVARLVLRPKPTGRALPNGSPSLV
jgi:hypothetical protein